MDSPDDTGGHRTFDTDEVMDYYPDADNTCAICQAEFLDTEDLVIHINQVHKIASTVLKKCQLCDKAYKDMMEYAEHVKDNHLTSLKMCSICWRTFDGFDAHRIHIKKHGVNASKSTYGCSQCPQKYVDLFSLKKHEYEHKNVREGFIMHELLPYLSAALKLKSVAFIETLGTDVVNKCVGCAFSTKDMTKYLQHVRSKNCKVYVCHTCGNVFKDKRNMVKHFSSSCNMFGVKQKKTRICPDCNVSIPVNMYAKHKSNCKPIKCYTCNITFQTVNDWSDHQSKEHIGRSIEVETCHFCYKRCVGSVAMKKHIDKIHRHEFHLYKYLCVYCKNVFKHPQKLFAHFTKHKDITPYTCKICNEVFRLRKRFTIHIKLKHDSNGFVEFDENYHVFFTEKKSENPFVPTSFYKDESSQNDSTIVSNVLDDDFMDRTDTDAYQTEPVPAEKPQRKQKARTPKTRKRKKSEIMTVESSDDSEPLNSVKRQVQFQKNGSIFNLKKKKTQTSNREAFTCKTCGKYCYTYQNYNHHVSLHSKHEVKKCIKCDEIFKSKTKLNEHIASAHSSSKLTETLKTLLEKRKTGGSLLEDLPMAVRFRRTLVKAQTEITPTSATIKPAEEKLSVKKFFENFVPEQIKPNPEDSVATIKLISGFTKEPSIKMTKFKPNPISTSLKLAMPVKFVDHFPEKIKMTMKVVETPCKIEGTSHFYSDHCDDSMDVDRQEPIPEVAEEVMLENTEETPKPSNTEIGHKIVIPKLYTNLTDIRIAHMLPEAPYYKIVKVKDVLSAAEKEQNIHTHSETKPPTAIKLADGTRLITTNPLAHLLGDKQDEVLQSVRSKYYRHKNRNIQGLLTKALSMLDKPTPIRKKKKVVSNLLRTEDEIEIKLEEDKMSVVG